MVILFLVITDAAKKVTACVTLAERKSGDLWTVVISELLEIWICKMSEGKNIMCIPHISCSLLKDK